MHFVIPDLISPSAASELCASLLRAPFADGRRSAGPAVIGRKHNLEMVDLRHLPSESVGGLITALKTNALLGRWALPRHSAPLMFNRYDEGMYYDDHVDNALGVIERRFVRTDLSVTVFLSPPEEYDGGELVIAADGAAQRIKLPAGHAIVYEAGTLHRVERVTRGTRLCAITWIESLVRSAERRQILFDLAQAIEEVDPQTHPGLRLRLEKCRTNLLRLWVDS